jgi:hypothetical protein
MTYNLSKLHSTIVVDFLLGLKLAKNAVSIDTLVIYLLMEHWLNGIL